MKPAFYLHKIYGKISIIRSRESVHVTRTVQSLYIIITLFTEIITNFKVSIVTLVLFIIILLYITSLSLCYHLL